MLAIGVILLFLGVAFNPVTAQTTVKDQMEVTTIGDFETITAYRKMMSLPWKNSSLHYLKKCHTATSYSDLVEIIQSFIAENGRHPVLVLLLYTGD